MSWVMPRRVVDLFFLLVEGGYVKECCSLEDGAYMHSLVCLEGEKS
jgi:hypothetical protein